MRGFTLIEILATIVIIAIIAIIAVPVINGVIELVKRESFRSSTINIARSSEYTFSNLYYFKGTNSELIFTYTDGVESSNIEGINLEYDGEKPVSGNLVVSSEGLTAFSLYNGEYCSVKEFYDKKVTVTKTTADDCSREMHLPTISLIGESEITLEINTNFIEEGYIAKTTMGEISTSVTRRVFFNEVEVADVDTSNLGEYLITYQVTEDSKMQLITRKLNIVDTTKPSLMIPEFPVLTIADLDGFNILSSIGVLDNSLETITPTSSGSIARIPGTYFITVSASDSSGNTESVIVPINVIDVEAPVITLNGDSVIDINYGSTYTELGATALDDSDLDVTSSIVITGSVNTTSVGTYFITYTVTDSSGNEASRTRTINVNDSIAPSVNFGTNGNVNYAKNHSTTVTVTDAHSGVASMFYAFTTNTTEPPAANISISFTNGATINTPAGVTGDYYLWIKAYDNVGNMSITRTNVFKLDNTVPVITLTGSPSLSIALGASYTDAGATASDNINGNLTGSIVRTGSVNSNIAGTYTLYYNVTDASGNTAVQVTRTVVVNSRTEYRYRDLYESCDTCYQTCQNTQAASSNTTYSCPGGYSLSGSTCTDSYVVYSSFTKTYACSGGQWLWSSQTCSGNCNAPCAAGYTKSDGGTAGYCPVTGSCSPNGKTTTCVENWSSVCTSTISATPNTTYSCSGGWTLSGTTCYFYYSCNPYSCNCSSYWGSWSAWSTTVYTASGSRQVETRQVTSI